MSNFFDFERKLTKIKKSISSINLTIDGLSIKEIKEILNIKLIPSIFDAEDKINKFINEVENKKINKIFINKIIKNSKEVMVKKTKLQAEDLKMRSCLVCNKLFLTTKYNRIHPECMANKERQSHSIPFLSSSTYKNSYGHKTQRTIDEQGKGLRS